MSFHIEYVCMCTICVNTCTTGSNFAYPNAARIGNCIKMALPNANVTGVETESYLVDYLTNNGQEDVIPQPIEPLNAGCFVRGAGNCLFSLLSHTHFL